MIQKDSAVSETMGFIYIFAIVILSMSLVYAVGYPVLQSSMDSSVFENTEQSFLVLQSSMKMVAFNQAPVKNLKIKLYGSALSILNNSNITVKYDSNIISYPTGSIEYAKGENTLTYENGGVWKAYSNGKIMVSHPQIYTSVMNNTNITTIGIVSINGYDSIGGKGIVTINMRHNISDIITSNNTNLTLVINSTYASQWASYLEDIGFRVTNLSATHVKAQHNNTKLIIGIHVVEVRLI